MPSESLSWYAIGTALIALLHLAASLAVTVHAVLHKRDSRAVISWVGLAWLAPLAGAIAYFCLGVNRIQRKAISLDIRKGWPRDRKPETTGRDLARRKELAEHFPNMVSLATLGTRITGEPVTPGNRVTPLVNGDESYPAMIAAIDAAERSVSLLTYIFDSDRAGDRFLDALLRARDRGVEVRVLIDHVGSRYSRPTMVQRMHKAGLRVAAFLPTRRPRFFRYSNLRNHRKILVADGRIGFTGGTNIREEHWLALRPDSPVQCLHFRFEGPVVGQLQEAFTIDWAFCTGEKLVGDAWFPELHHAGSVWARGIPDGPDEDFEKIQESLLGALASATRSVRILTPYFLPPASLIDALCVTALRGIHVDIVLPSVNNLPIMQWAAVPQLATFIEKGCRIHFSPPPFDHTKLLVVDGVWSLIGSSNWDPRSLRLNFEYNVECYDDALAGHLTRLADGKIAASRRVTAEELNSRALRLRLRDGMARLMTPYL